MYIIFYDMKESFNNPRYYYYYFFQNINFQELLYTDNILIIAKSAKTTNTYLYLIE